MTVVTAMKLVCFLNINGVDVAKAITTFGDENNCAAFVKTKPGVGKPFLVYATLPPGVLLGAEFEDLNYPAPIVSSDTAVNLAKIQEMLATPTPYLALLTFA